MPRCSSNAPTSNPSPETASRLRIRRLWKRKPIKKRLKAGVSMDLHGSTRKIVTYLMVTAAIAGIFLVVGVLSARYYRGDFGGGVLVCSIASAALTVLCFPLLQRQV